MIVATNEYRLLAITSLHLLIGVLLGSVIASVIETVLPIVVCASIFALSGTLHASRLLRHELRRAYLGLAEAVVIVNRTRGLGLTPDEFSAAIATTVTDRLAAHPFRLIKVKFST